MKSLIEDWFPIETVGCESMREGGESSAPCFLYVWWARRPLRARRAGRRAGQRVADVQPQSGTILGRETVPVR